METRSKTKKVLYEQLNRAIQLQEDGETNLEALETLKEIIEETNKNTIDTDYKDRADNIDEVLLDAKIISSSTNICLNAVDTFDINMDSYNLDDFSSHLTRYLKMDDGEEIPNWEKLEDDVMDSFKITPTFIYLYGVFKEKDITPSQKERERTVRGKFEACAKQKPDKIVAVNKEEEGVDETVKIMLSILREYCKTNQNSSVSYFHFVIDDDYTKTIENIFHFAFLIRDGAAQIYVDEKDNLPYIQPKSKSSNQENDRLENTQQVLSLDWNDWMSLRKCLNIDYFFK
ncbi:EP300-interacting inhibitor of differentiation 3-like [Chrysoperla carnea]|uniref:EP300-interacting inhibitor of differentiation 3-like n=1 Tax=Chrysoperla carnea TaxID=189513 RepID=UPI001D07713E|nr:EP300-interacting inhibitor of differentiation 3-like [Chrysoperla carnea]